MKRYVYKKGLFLDELVRIEEAIPVEGVDFCSRCGADLALNGEFLCYVDEMSGAHWWTTWENEPHVDYNRALTPEIFQETLDLILSTPITVKDCKYPASPNSILLREVD